MLLLDKRYQKSFHVHISIKTLSYKQIKQPIRSHGNHSQRRSSR